MAYFIFKILFLAILIGLVVIAINLTRSDKDK